MKRKIISSSLVVLALTLACCAQQQPLVIAADGYGATTLANGVRVAVNQDRSTSLSAARIVIGGGILTETAADNGISNLMIKMLLKGKKSMSASQITERLDFLGASVSADCFRDFTAISISSLSENFPEVMEIIATSLKSPTFPEEELAKLKSEVEGDIKASDDSQGQASSKLFWRTAYGDQEYGLPTLGTLETMKRITAAGIRAHFDKYVGGRNMVVAIATDLSVEQITTLLQNCFGGIKAEAEEIRPLSAGLRPEKSGFISYDRNQSYVFMGYFLDRLPPRDVPCVLLLNQIMGGSVGSRLWGLRQTEKLAYEVYAQWGLNKHVTVFRSAIGTDTTKVKQALSSLDREWKKLRTEGVTERELADAKLGAKNNLIYGIDVKSARANNMAFYEYVGYGYRFPLDLIASTDKVTLAEVNDFAKTRLGEDRRYVSVVGKQ